MAYFGSHGSILDSSGGPEILFNAEILATGSMQGFISGKHFNCCKRIHPLFALALQILHFQQFLEKMGDLSQECVLLLNDFAKAPSPTSFSTLLGPRAILKLLDEYDEFCNKTRKGCHGSTPQVWLIYIDLVHIYMHFDRACRTNNVSLFVYSLRLMCSIFFATF